VLHSVIKTMLQGHPDLLILLTNLYLKSYWSFKAYTCDIVSLSYSASIVQLQRIVLCYPNFVVCQDSVVGIATCYRLDGQGIESCWSEIFCTRADWPCGPPSVLYNGYWVSFQGVKWLGCGIDHPFASSADGKERVELYLFSPSVPSW
jgi:hypothetical protein